MKGTIFVVKVAGWWRVFVAGVIVATRRTKREAQAVERQIRRGVTA